jgi:hypothetical protein
MDEPAIGEKVLIRPRLGLAVQYEDIYGRFLKEAGQEVIWSVWWHKRFRDGSIEILRGHEELD